ncbi:hypothetical protein, partial [Rhabdonatronobacter sediminivivens]|uniref:hypothetical protein n=1 Tax=Rhabdonatronobacter sediminivivens TaxID=2743469 RepID=UPI001F406138
SQHGSPHRGPTQRGFAPNDQRQKGPAQLPFATAQPMGRKLLSGSEHQSVVRGTGLRFRAFRYAKTP